QAMAESIRQTGFRTALLVPLVHGQTVTGVLDLRRRGGIRPFSPEEIVLAETFAAHAAIAVGGARLVHDLDQKNQELGEALERQTGLRDVLRIISESPRDLERALTAVLTQAGRLCGAGEGGIWRVEGGDLVRIARLQDVPNEPVRVRYSVRSQTLLARAV